MNPFDFNIDAMLGVLNQDQVDDLRKALEIGYDQPETAPTTPGVGAAFRVESLDRTLYSTLFTEEHAPFFRNVPMKPAKTVVEEYNVLLSYGDEQQGLFVPEIALPEEVDSRYQRKLTRIKYLAALGRASFVATIVESAHGDPVAIETVNKTRLLISQIERSLFYGDSAAEPLEFDGVYKLITDVAPNNVVDVRGSLSNDVVFDGVRKVAARPNFGRPTDLFMDYSSYTDYSKALLAAGRYTFVGADLQGQAGLHIDRVDTPHGPVNLHADVFLTDGRGDPDGVFNSGVVGQLGKRPGTPTVTQAIAAAPLAVNPASYFTGTYLGTYYYKVVAVNARGRSTPVQLGPVTTTGVNNEVTFGITPDPSVPLPTHYRVYRTGVGGAAGTEKYIGRFAASATGGQTIIADANWQLPGATDAFLFEFNEQAMRRRELLGMIRIPLGILDTSVRWIQMAMMAMEVMKPTHQMIYHNVLPLPGSLT